ncbi:helicase HerA domain-containing protein [Aeromonas veronii]
MSESWFSPHDSNRRIGSLVDMSATEAKINLTKAGSGEQTWILGTRIPVGEVNEFVFIDCGQLSILARVVKVWLENGERLSVEGLDDSHPNNNPIGIVQLLVSVDVETGFNHRGVKQYPRLGAQVYAAHPKLVSMLAEGVLNTSANDLQLPIAEMPHDSSVNIGITPEKLFSRHCAILGSTGGGKSYTMANLMENVYEHGGKILLIDATGEYENLPCESYYVGENTNAKDGQKVTYPHWMFTDTDLRALLRPSAQSQAPKLEAAIQSLRVVTQYYQTANHGLPISTSYTMEKAGRTKANFENAVQAISTFESKTGIQIISATLMDEWREVANC